MKSNRTMKITLLVAVLVVAGGFAALFYTMEEEKGELTQQSLQLEHELALRDSAYNEIIEIMYSVESKIELIKEREHLIADLSTGDVDKADKLQLSKDMSMIDSLILETNEKVTDLTARLNKANINMKSFQRKIKDLSSELEDRKASLIAMKEDLEAKDIQIGELTANVSTLEGRVDSANSTIEIQKQRIDQQEEEMNKAYMAIGTEKILQEEGLVTREGGFLGLGKSTDLSDNISREKFEQIDIRTTSELKIDSKKINLITEHPPHSYELLMDGEKVKAIKITNPEEFWKISKYLVVAVNS